MGLSLKDVRATSRRTGAATALYPRLLRDGSTRPQIDVAIQYCESMLGRERREFDPDVLVHFFGDPKLARGMLACLARTYRFEPRQMDDEVTRAGARRLRRFGIDSPKSLRLWVFDRLNDFGYGFLAQAERAQVVADMEARLSLRAGELDRLLLLDQEEHARLTRMGAVPRAADVQAHYNFAVLETLVRHAERVELEIRAEPYTVEAAAGGVAAADGVDAHVEQWGKGVRVILLGRQDALGSWSRHGRYVSRAMLHVLEQAGGDATGGTLTLAFGGRKCQVRLTAEPLAMLGAVSGLGWDSAPPWDQATVAERGAMLRAEGWSVRRLPEAQRWEAGVAVPELLAQKDGTSVMVCRARSARHAERLTALAAVATSGPQLAVLAEDGSPAPVEGRADRSPGGHWERPRILRSIRSPRRTRPDGPGSRRDGGAANPRA